VVEPIRRVFHRIARKRSRFTPAAPRLQHRVRRTAASRPWHAEPRKSSTTSARANRSVWAVTTSAGIILIDAIFDYSVDDEVVGGLKKLGLDPAMIKYVVISHGHSDHSGGAKYLQDRFNARVILTAADWDLLDRSNGTKPRRDMVAVDGQKLTLGDTTLTLYNTPGHTMGTLSTLIPVTDHGAPHVAVSWGGTAFNWVANRTAYITPDRPDRFWFQTYSDSARRFREIAARAGADVLISNHDLDGSRPSCRRSNGGSPAIHVRMSSFLMVSSAT
jgi:metallo-beta-lactamase class B